MLRIALLLNQCMILSSGLVVQSDHLGTFEIHKCPELRTDRWCQISGLRCSTNLPQVIFVCSLVEGYQVKGGVTCQRPLKTFQKGSKEKNLEIKYRSFPSVTVKNPLIIAFAISTSRRRMNTPFLLHGRSIRWVVTFPFVFVLLLFLTSCCHQPLLAVWLKMSSQTFSWTPVFHDIPAQAFPGSVKTKWGNI